MSKKTVIRILPLLAASLLLAACAGTGAVHKTDGSSQAALKERALQRWNDLIAKDAAKAYDYLTPGYRQTISREQYALNMNQRPVLWKKVTMNQVACETASRCNVFVIIDYRAPMPSVGAVTASAPIKEQWLLLDNQWYYLPSK